MSHRRVTVDYTRIQATYMPEVHAVARITDEHGHSVRGFGATDYVNMAFGYDGDPTRNALNSARRALAEIHRRGIPTPLALHPRIRALHLAQIGQR